MVTFTELSALVDRAADEMHGDGVLAGDRVLIVAENCAQHVALIIACSRIGAWSCGVNARMTSAEIAAFAQKADPRAIYFTTTVSKGAREAARHFAAFPSALIGLHRSPVRTEAVAEVSPAVRDVAAIIFTSGTTGAPKGVLVTHHGLLQFARASATSRELTAEDRVYAYLPMTHIFGLGTVLMASLYAGAGMVLRSKVSPSDVLEVLAHQRVSNLQGPPPFFGKLLRYMESHAIVRPDAPHLRYLYAGAAPLDSALKRAVEGRFHLPLHHGYGLSEYAGSLCITAIDSPRNDTSAGCAVAGAELKIVDSQGSTLSASERGEIWIRGPGLMPGYFRDPEATRQAMRAGGWYATGDVGYLTIDGALFVVGRLKEMIIRSGFNVYPADVEAVLNAFPTIHHSAVVGCREADGNEEILAFVEPRSGMVIDHVSLREFFRERLAPYKRPSRVITVDALPLTDSGKVVKRHLLDLVCALQGPKET
jgi:acyl-CoA synthetase (AMP-forming)/AMP-acid ligase II